MEGRILCAWLEGNMFSYIYNPSGITLFHGWDSLNNAWFKEGGLYYPDEEIAKANEWVAKAKRGEQTDFRDCDNCPGKFVCFTQRWLRGVTQES